MCRLAKGGWRHVLNYLSDIFFFARLYGFKVMI